MACGGRMWLAVLPLVTVVFWNVENLFEERPGFYRKCNAVAKTLMMIGDEEGGMPDVIGLAEVESRRVLEKLVRNTGLRKFGYEIVHYDSPDRRGIDCALLYRRNRFSEVRSRACHLLDSAGRSLRTRDILLVEMDSLSVLVNHHPSKVGKDSEGRRRMAMDRMKGICDSLEREGRHRILCAGDFNENLWGPFRQGTIKYNGRWDKIDGYFARGLEVRERVFTAPHLLTVDRAFGGRKPFRAYSGPRYTGGVSDHLPVIYSF